MKYAPVIVATLNRKEHLQRCLESLDRNTVADQTCVYVSVDYPPNEKYVHGHREVKEYLRNAEFRFKEFVCFFQEENLGASANFELLKSHARKVSDTYILTEDDNEFAPNFLSYVNKGLEKFRDDDKVLAICGYKDAEWICNNEGYTMSKLFPAYGYGAWFKKDEIAYQNGEKILFSKEYLKFNKIFELNRKNKCLFVKYISDIICTNKGLFWNNGNFRWCDSAKSILMHWSRYVVIVPQIGKSRTWGNDGSGQNMPNLTLNADYQVNEIDRNTDFEYVENDTLVYNEKNYKIGDAYLAQCVTNKRILGSWIKYALLAIVGFDRNSYLEKFGK